MSTESSGMNFEWLADIADVLAAALHALATVLRDQGDLAGARQKLERSLEIKAAVFGTREHYNVAITETNLGQVLILDGEPEQGLELLLHALTVFHERLGPQHPLTQQTIETLRNVAPS